MEPLKSRFTKDYVHHTDAQDSFVIGRDYRSLLRSTGHLKRDGLWTGADTPFHVYRETENPGIGALRTFSGGDYYRHLDPSESQVPANRNFSWRPVLTRLFSYDSVSDVYETPMPNIVEPSFSSHVLDLNNRGAAYITKYRPGNPLATLFQFIGELHELPRLPIFLKNRAKHFRDLGSEYLNVEFGWKPFVQDLVKLYRAQQEIRGVLDKLVKNNGIRVKRRSKHEVSDTADPDDNIEYVSIDRPFPGRLDGRFSTSTDITDGLFLLGPTNTGQDYNIPGYSSFRKYTSLETITWFVGTFFYYVPDIGSDRWTQKCKDNLFGQNPDPFHLYELYPWSWLVDWFSNVGKVLSNLQSNVVDNEAYLDCHVMQTITDVLHVRAQVFWDGYEVDIDVPPITPSLVVSPGSDTLTFSLITKEKLRQQASPFGFGLSFPDFTLRQKAILAALLVSKKRPTPRYIGS